jgi:hypothetical protein
MLTYAGSWPLRRRDLGTDTACVIVAPEDPAQRAWLWVGKAASEGVEAAAWQECVRLAGGREAAVDRYALTYAHVCLRMLIG